METTVMPAAVSVQKQQGLNQVVINKVQRMIEGRQGGVMDTINRLLSEGRIAQDFIAPIGVSQRSKELRSCCAPCASPKRRCASRRAARRRTASASTTSRTVLPQRSFWSAFPQLSRCSLMEREILTGIRRRRRWNVWNRRGRRSGERRIRGR